LFFIGHLACPSLPLPAPNSIRGTGFGELDLEESRMIAIIPLGYHFFMLDFMYQRGWTSESLHKSKSKKYE
jgi:hypothetical protein